MKYLMIAFALCALPVLGCAEEDGVENGDGGAGGTGASGGSGGSAGTGTVTTGIRFTEVDAEGTSTNLDGVELCQADTDNCDISDGIGVAVIEVPADQEITLTAEKEGYVPWITGDVSNGDADLITIRRMHTHAQMTEVMEQQLGGSYPLADGVVGLVRFPTHSAGGVTFAPVGDTANEVGNSFYFDGTTEEYGTEHGATGPYGGLGYVLPLGDGGFMSVTEGVQTFELGGTGGDCPVSWGWPGDTPNHIRVPVRAGYRTYGSWNCELP